MKNIRQSKPIKLLWLFVTFLLFNYSIDIPDSRTDNFSEDLSINDIESFTELVLEKIVGIENAVPEHDDDDSDGQSLNLKKIDLLHFTHAFINEKQTIVSTTPKKKKIEKRCTLQNNFIVSQEKPPQA